MYHLEVDAFCVESGGQCEKILFQKGLDICADDFKRLSYYYYVYERSSSELAMVARLQVAGFVIELLILPQC